MRQAQSVFTLAIVGRCNCFRIRAHMKGLAEVHMPAACVGPASSLLKPQKAELRRSDGAPTNHFAPSPDSFLHPLSLPFLIFSSSSFPSSSPAFVLFSFPFLFFIFTLHLSPPCNEASLLPELSAHSISSTQPTPYSSIMSIANGKFRYQLSLENYAVTGKAAMPTAMRAAETSLRPARFS